MKRYIAYVEKRLPDAPEHEPFSEHFLGASDSLAIATNHANAGMRQPYAVCAYVIDAESDASDENVYYTQN